MKKKIAIMMLGVMMLATPAISASASAKNNPNCKPKKEKCEPSSRPVVGRKGGKGGEANNSGVHQSVTYKAAKNLPGLVGAAAIDNRSPELMLNNEARLLDAAEAEIMSTIGKGYTDTYKYTENGVTAIVAYNSNACTVHVYPSGSSKGVTPAVLDMVANKAASKIEMTLTLLQKFVSIENHSNGMGASVSPNGSAVNQASNVGSVVGLITGNRGRTSQRIRVELVYVGGK